MVLLLRPPLPVQRQQGDDSTLAGIAGQQLHKSVMSWFLHTSGALGFAATLPNSCITSTCLNTYLHRNDTLDQPSLLDNYVAVPGYLQQLIQHKPVQFWCETAAQAFVATVLQPRHQLLQTQRVLRSEQERMLRSLQHVTASGDGHMAHNLSCFCTILLRMVSERSLFVAQTN